MTRKLFFYFLLIVVIATVNAGCATSGSSSQSIDLPDWVLSPMQDNINTLYGIGQGSTLDAAKQAALADVAAKLFVRVSGSTTVEIQADNNIVMESVKDSIKTQINETQLSHYNMDQVASVGESYWVQLNIPRDILVQNTEKSLHLSNRELDDSFHAFKELSSVQQYIKTSELKNDTDSAITLWILLQALEPARKNDAQDRVYSSYMSLLLQAKESLSFSIVNSDDTTGFAELLSVLLSKESIEAKLTNNQNIIGPSIKISGKFKTFSLFDEKQVQADVTIKVFDERGDLIAKRHHSMAGTSVSSYDSAKRSAARRLSDKFEAQGVQESLGISTST